MDVTRLDFLSQFDDLLAECSDRVRWHAVNSISHLRWSAKISEIDPLMAAFRAICAEEEAATSLICSLQQCDYEFSERIGFRNHTDKHAVIVFIRAVMDWFKLFQPDISKFFGDLTFYKTELPGRKALGIALPLKDGKTALNPVPPLNLRVQGKSGTEWSHIIRSQLSEMFDSEKDRRFKKSIEGRANFRNKLLYATPAGIPGWRGSVDEFVLNQAGIVYSLLTAMALIDPWRKPNYEPSPVVTASISVFLEIMGRVDLSTDDPE